MNPSRPSGFEGLDEALFQQAARRATTGMNAAASSGAVNRTHRIVRERARTLQTRRARMRSLWIPLGVSAGLLAVITFAIWSVLDQYEITPTGVPDANQQLLVLMMWCLPVSVVLLGVVWFRRDVIKSGEGKA